MDGKIVAFARDVTEGTFPTTLLVDTKWWDPYNTDDMSKSEVVTSLLGLIPTVATTPEETAEGNKHFLLLESLASLQIVVLLPT